MTEIREHPWSVVCVAKEKADVIQRFVAWHLDAGASQITIYFDDPNDPNIEMVAHLRKVVAVPCTPEFWASLGLTKKNRFTKRQNSACRHGYDHAPAGWVLNIDADELLVVEGQSVGQYLAKLESDCRSVLIEPVERILVDGLEEPEVFRTKMGREQSAVVYGDIAGFVVRNSGLVGHDVGKSILRTDLGKFWLRQHFGQLSDGTQIVDKVANGADGAFLLHYFSRGYDDWRRKLDYRLANQGFRHRMRAALAEARDANDESALRTYYERLHFVDAKQLAYLRAEGLLYEPDLKIDEKIARYF